MKKDYMARLERWAKWMLPRQEADDVLGDYRDIAADPELGRELGKPREVIQPLVQKKQYRAWLAVFVLMAACILAPGISSTAIGYPLWLLLFDGWAEHPYAAYLAGLGAAAALVWFRWQGQKNSRLPRAIPILLAVFLVCIGVVLLFCWTCSRDFDAFLELWGRMKLWIGPNKDAPRSFHLSRLAMAYGSPILAFLGVYGLVKARTGDRRWAAVYVLALTAMLTALLVLDWSGRIYWPADSAPEDLFRLMLLRGSGIAAVGLVGTGVALL